MVVQVSEKCEEKCLNKMFSDNEWNFGLCNWTIDFRREMSAYVEVETLTFTVMAKELKLTD